MVREISVLELKARRDRGEMPLVLDVRSRSAWHGDQIPGSVHVYPDEVVPWAARQGREREVVAYCT